jgi:predicted ribosome quality control (RQC) complex YloA/Tae2 family protein
VGSQGRPYRTLEVEGFQILVGRGAAENDLLTFDVAAPEDLWLHVASGVPGSHVVIRNPDNLEELPATVVERAAALAVWHSKARGRRRVDVHLCRVADVSKQKRAPAGEVVLRRWTTVRVYQPDAASGPPRTGRGSAGA